MNAELLSLYHRCRRDKPFMRVGRDAECSLAAAKTILAFRELESRGLVRMRAEPETDNYFDVFGDEGTPAQRKRTEEIIERLGCWWTVSEWFDGDEWQHADSCGMHTGYKNPLDPFENCYVIDEMQAAVDAWNAHLEEMAGAV